MSSEARTGTTADTETGTLNAWQAGVASGLIGGLFMGAVISILNPQTISVAIAGMYGLQGGIIGWIAHMSHSAIFGVVFAAIVTNTDVRWSVGRSAIAGLVYGAILWIVMAGIVMPVWLNVVGLGNLMKLPNWGLPGSLPAHLLYGVILGAVFSLVRR